MGWVGIERAQVTLGNGVLTADHTLVDTGMTIANCIPFVQMRVTTHWTDEASQYLIDAYLWDDAGTKKCRVQRNRAESNEAEVLVELTILEVDGTDLVLESGTFNLPQSGTNTTTANVTDDLGSTDSFLYFNYMASGTSIVTRSHLVRGRITTYGASSQLTFDRNDDPCEIDGHWYTLRDDAGTIFDVQATTVSIADAASTGDSADLSPTVTESKTFILGSHLLNRVLASSDDPAEHSCDIKLLDNNTVRATRQGSVDVLDWAGFVVSLKDSSNVYRGTISTSSAGDPDPAGHTSIGATVTLADSMVHTPGCCGNFFSGGHSGDSGDETPDACCAWTFFSTTQIDCRHTTNSANSLPGSVSWEVIEFDTGGGETPARRVMVIS